jgi:hypothetical protein
MLLSVFGEEAVVFGLGVGMESGASGLGGESANADGVLPPCDMTRLIRIKIPAHACWIEVQPRVPYHNGA